MSKMFRVEIEAVENPENGFERLDIFTVKAKNEDQALDAAYGMAAEQYPNIRVFECGGIEEG